MPGFVARRVMGCVVSIVVISVLCFLAVNVLPGNPATAILGKDATPARVKAIELGFGLNKPLPVRYWDWLRGIVLHLDFGHSLTQGVGTFGLGAAHGDTVTSVIRQPLLNSIVLASVALAVLFVTSLLIGVGSALRRGRLTDTSTQTLSLLLISFPEFVLGTFLILLFAFAWPILPAVSLAVTPAALVLPVVTLVFANLGSTARLVRVGVSEVLESNFVANARLRGVPERVVLRRHVLPNALGPTLQVFAMVSGTFIGGIVIVEYLFGYPGLGSSFVNAVSGRDYPVVLAYALIMATVYVVANLVVDLLRIVLNPKARAELAR